MTCSARASGWRACARRCRRHSLIPNDPPPTSCAAVRCGPTGAALPTCAPAAWARATAAWSRGQAVSFGGHRASEHRGADDLLSAGLGLAGLRAPVPPAFADPERPTTDELRRRALWANWRGIADLRPGGMGEGYGSLEPVPGREF